MSEGPLGKIRPIVCDDAVWTAISKYNVLQDFTAVCPSSFRIGFNSTHLVNLSTITKMCVILPQAGRRGPTISKHQVAKGQVIGIVFNTDYGRCVCLLNLWHP